MIDYLLSIPWYGLIWLIGCFVVILSSWLSLIIPDEKVEEYSSHNLDALRYGIMLKKKIENKEHLTIEKSPVEKYNDFMEHLQKNKEKLTIKKHNIFMEYLQENKIKLNEAELNAYIKLVYNSNIFNKKRRIK